MAKRDYQTTPTMLENPLSVGEVQYNAPDAKLIEQLHMLLDPLPWTHAMVIDHVVAELLKFHNPAFQRQNELIMPKGAHNDVN